ncbi:MAG: DUF4149 domain-containing protein [Burkholderiaceae bacterium]|nr:DUF4149 domain-containing protein [Burkholderiaceae bacterium]
MHITAQRLFVFILTLWVGSVITVGYIVAPALFATLTDTQVAGMVAGTLFRIEGTISFQSGHRITYFTAPTTVVFQLILDDAVYGQLDGTNVLG